MLAGALAGPAAWSQEAWTPVTSGVTAELRGAAFGGGVFVVVGAEGTILRSTDRGRTWQARSRPDLVPGVLVEVAYGNGVFLATDGSVVLRSEDHGLGWSLAGDLGDDCGGLAFGGGRWIAACQAAILASTSQGASWSPVYDPPGETAGAEVVASGGTFVVVGGSIQASLDAGASFADVGHDYTSWLVDVAAGNGAYVAIGGLFGNFVIRSSIPTEWPAEGGTDLDGVTGLQAIAFGNEVFVLTTDSGKILVGDGVHAWRTVESGVPTPLWTVAHGDGTFVAAGDAGAVWVSGRAPEIDSPLTATGVVGQAFSYAVTARYGPSSFGASGLPGGLGIDPVSGRIEGKPLIAGTFAVSMSAENAYGTDVRVLNLTIQPAGSGGGFTLKVHTAVELEWNSQSGKSYQVQASPDLKAWTPHEGPIPGTGAPMFRLYSTRDPAHRYFRVQEL